MKNRLKSAALERHKLRGDRDVERIATCGACGCERVVTGFMRWDFCSQFRARPTRDTDVFYCGCQSQ